MPPAKLSQGFSTPSGSTMEDTAQQAIATRLSQHMGLNPDSLGPKTLARAIESRQHACHIPDVSAYCHQLQQSPQELEALIEAVVVPETWFFRDRQPFVLLQESVQSDGFLQRRPSRSNKSRPLRILSLPCSTGEEPHSIAMALLDAGLCPNQFQIDAVDISHNALDQAKQGIYRPKSFRGEDLAFRNRYFQAVSDRSETYELTAAVRQTVTFIHSNILDSQLVQQLGGRSRYDIIFCRNLLIYFNQTSRTQVFTTLSQLLNPSGLLFVGAAETGAIPLDTFTSVRRPFTFAYRKGHTSENPVSVSPQTAQSASRRNGKKTSSPIRNSSTRKRSVAPVRQQYQQLRPEDQRQLQTVQLSKDVIDKVQSPAPLPSAPSIPSSDNALATARELANRGQLTRAATLCQKFLINHRTSAAAYTLLGEIHTELDQPREAERCFQRAAYLDPQAAEALLHLALLKEKRGNLSAAAVLRQRLRRIGTVEQ